MYAGFGDLGLRDKCCYVEDRFPRLVSLEDPVSGIALVEATRTQAIGHRTTDSAKSKALSESFMGQMCRVASTDAAHWATEPAEQLFDAEQHVLQPTLGSISAVPQHSAVRHQSGRPLLTGNAMP